MYKGRNFDVSVTYNFFDAVDEKGWLMIQSYGLPDCHLGQQICLVIDGVQRQFIVCEKNAQYYKLEEYGNPGENIRKWLTRGFVSAT